MKNVAAKSYPTLSKIVIGSTCAISAILLLLLSIYPAAYPVVTAEDPPDKLISKLLAGRSVLESPLYVLSSYAVTK